jgi:hypothetical protein
VRNTRILQCQLPGSPRARGCSSAPARPPAGLHARKGGAPRLISWFSDSEHARGAGNYVWLLKLKSYRGLHFSEQEYSALFSLDHHILPLAVFLVFFP